ncbi:WD40 repeat-like protein [Suillus weaverae]|nr:WD40 repeat-like protein [Suillus weaverae]
MDNFQEQVTHDVAIYVYRTGETLDLSIQMTRTEIISEITDWVNSTGDDVQRVLWLSGPAGKSKSTMAHTIDNWFNDMGGLGSCYCFDNQRNADRRHENIFFTIAHDLTDRDPEMRRPLAEAVEDASLLKEYRPAVGQASHETTGEALRPIIVTSRPLRDSKAELAGSLSLVLSGWARIATGSADNTVRLWDATTGQPVSEPSQGSTNSITSVSLSPDGTGTVRLLDTATGQPLCEFFQVHIREVSSISFSPDGTRMATGSRDNTVRLWDAVTGQPVGEPLMGHTDEIRSISFSQNGTRIATGSDDKTVRLWDAGTGKPVGEPLRRHNHGVRSVSFSSNGTLIATGCRDKIVQLWDAATGQPVGEPLMRHIDVVSSVSFSPNGTCIVTGSDDKTVRLWDVGMGKLDGTRIVSGSNDETV